MTRYHALIPSLPTPSHWAKRCEVCGMRGAERSRDAVRKSMAGTGIEYTVEVCTCEDTCRCGEGEPSGM